MSAIPVIALKPPKPKMKAPKQRAANLCDACDRPILPTGECGGCTGS